MTHLTPDELVDAVEGTLSADRRAHVEECDGCGRQVADLSGLLNRTRAIDIPEPSPLFWQRFSDRVRVAIATEPVTPQQPPWFTWPVLAPLAGLALLIVALGAAVSRETSTPDAPAVVAESSDERDPAEDTATLEAVWALAADLVGSTDGSEAHEAELIVTPGSAERAAGQLSSAEQAELVRLLQEELGRSGG